MAVRRIFSSLSVLTSLKENGYDVGKLKWKKPREFRSIVFNQSGFDVDSNTGRTDHATLELSKIGTMDLEYHHDIPADGTIKEVRLKEEKSGDWYASIVVDVGPDYLEKPAVETIDVEDTVGIDVGVQKFTHDSNGVAVAPLDETALRERIETRHRALSRKEYDSNNWDRARQRLAATYERARYRRKDFREKLAHLYTTKYDAVFLEDLNVRTMLEGNRNSRNMTAMSWSETVSTFERHGDKNGCHVITVPPKGTTKECANCGVETEKPLWVREHSCPACGYEADRDENTAYNIQMRGLDEVGIEYDQNTLIGLRSLRERLFRLFLQSASWKQEATAHVLLNASRPKIPWYHPANSVRPNRAQHKKGFASGTSSRDMRRLLGLLLLAPLIDIVILVLVAIFTPIGWVGTVAIVIITSLLGLLLVRAESRQTVRNIRREVRRGNLPTDELLDGGLLAVAGASLFMPGYLSDIMGLLLVIPVTRWPIRKGLKRFVVVPYLDRKTGGIASGSVYGGGFPEQETYDVGADEYEVHDEST